MGLLDSLGQILPYAIPAVAGAALGGPGLAMVGAGGAAQAQTQNLDKQLQIANLLNESQYRNADLGLRRQEIQSNEQLRKLSLKQTGQEHAAALAETKSRDTEHAQEHQDSLTQARQFHDDTMAFRAQMAAFQQGIANEREEDKRTQMQEQQRDHIRAQIERTQKTLKSATEQAWKTQGFVKKDLPESMGGANRDQFEQSYMDRNMPVLLQKAGITPESMRQAGFSEGDIQETFPNYGGSAPAPSPSQKLKAAAKGGGGEAATFKTSMPDTPPGHGYHLNGKYYEVKGGVATEVPNG